MTDWEDFKKFYNVVVSEVYHEPDSFLTTDVVDKMLPGFLSVIGEKNKDMPILDLGCGSGYALEKMREAGYTNCEGLTLNDDDIRIVKEKGFNVHKLDFNFTGWKDKWKAIWMRHVLEHSPFPLYTIFQLNKMMQIGGVLYVEMPTPAGVRNLEHWPNHYSIMGSPMYKSLFERAGFRLVQNNTISISLKEPKLGDIMEEYDWYLLQKVQEIKID